MIRIGTTNESTRFEWVRQKLTQVPAGWRILDAGAGEQPYRKYCDHLKYVSQDFGQYKPDAMLSGLQMSTWNYGPADIISDIAAIPEPDGSFDAILCIEVLEHLPDPVQVISELARLLRKGGWLIVSAPFCSLTHFAPYHFSTGFSRFFYEKHLPENGLRLVEVTPNGNYFEYLGQELRRLNKIAKRYGGVQPGRLEQYAIHKTLKMLQRFSDHDAGSHELLAFGFHVVAEKEF